MRVLGFGAWGLSVFRLEGLLFPELDFEPHSSAKIALEAWDLRLASRFSAQRPGDPTPPAEKAKGLGLRAYDGWLV